MMKILTESLQDISDFLLSTDLRKSVLKRYPDISPESDVLNYIMEQVASQYDDTPRPEIVTVSALKVVGYESDVMSTSHKVIQFNGSYYDFTANQFTEEFSNLIKVSMLPVVQPVIKSDSQIKDTVSTIKSYVLLGD